MPVPSSAGSPRTFKEALSKSILPEPVDAHAIWHRGFDTPVLSEAEGLSPNGIYLIGTSLNVGFVRAPFSQRGAPLRIHARRCARPFIATEKSR